MGLLGKEKSKSGVAVFVRQNIEQALCNYAEAIEQQIIHTKR